MKKMLFPAFAVLAVLSCGGDMDDLPPCLGGEQACGLCGSRKWDRKTEFCFEGTVYSKCGGSDYNSSTQFCSGNTVYSKCSGSDYNSSTQFCSGNTVYSKCGNSDYNPSTQFCSGSTVYSKCSGSDYNPSTEFCSSSTIYSKCGNSDYNPSTQFCSSNTIYSKCGSSDYNPSTQFCSNVTVKAYSGSVTYQGQTYKTIIIGTQTWMAENLDYVVEGSKCYNNDPVNCNTYGSLYNWVTAMALPSSCNSNSCSSPIQSPHRGLCPSGWHISSYDEWNTLSNYVQSNSGCIYCDARLLKSTSGWNSEDPYGFSALPGGYGNSGGSFYSVGNFGGWWSASEYNSNSAYYRYMGHNNDRAYGSNDFKSNLLSVRCLQD